MGGNNRSHKSGNDLSNPLLYEVIKNLVASGVDLAAIEVLLTSLDTKEGSTGAASDVDGTRAAQLRYIGEAIDTLANRVEELEGGGAVLIGKPALGDFTTAYQSATAIDCTSLPSSHSALIDEDIERIVHFNTSGAVVATYLRDEIGIVVTVPVAGTYRLTISGATTFTNTDTFLVETNVSKASSSSSGVSSGGLSTWTLDDTNSFGQGQITTGGTGLATITVDTFYCAMVAKNILQIERWNSAGVWQATYTHRDSTITVSGTTITVVGGVWGASDTFKVKYDGIERTTDLSSNAQIVELANSIEFNTEDSEVVPSTAVTTGGAGCVLTTTVSTGIVASAVVGASGGSNYVVGDYLFIDGGTGDKAIAKVATLAGNAVATVTIIHGGSGYTAGANQATTKLTYVNGVDGVSIAPHKSLSISGNLLDVDGIIAIQIEGSNNIAGATDVRKWHSCYFYNNENNTTVNIVSCNSTQTMFSCDFDKFNYALFRIVLLTKTAGYTYQVYQNKTAI